MRLKLTLRARVLVLLGIVVVLELVTFLPYFTGQLIPPWDFLGSYSTDAYLWWSQGGFFTPLDWIPSLWGGYPSSLNLQNSAWYLPVGVASLFGDPSLQSASVLAALHVVIGYAGTYRLVRSLGASFSIGVIVAVAAFFAVGYFSNAEHVDIARAYALIPWVLLALSPAWPWRRFWAIPVATLILWQAVTGMYPGMVVATVYVGVVWIVVSQWRVRPSIRAFLLPAAVSAVAAVLLSAPRLLPYFLTQEPGSIIAPDASLFSPAMVGTLLFGYGSPELPNDITMRSFFIPATVLVLAFFARFTHSATQQALAIGIPAALMGLPFLPWFDLVQSLPGLGLSRFTMSDFKVHMVLAVLLLASSGLRSLAALESPVPRRMLFGFAASGAFTVLMGVVGVRGPYSLGAWLPGLLTLVASLGAIAVYWLARRRAWTLPRAVELWPVLAGVLVLGTAASGLYWAFSNPVPWRTDRVAAEVQAYGSTVEDLLAQRVDYTGATQRPARIPPTDGYTLSDLRSVKGNRVYYTGEYSVGGYLNLKGSLTPEQLESALMDESTGTEFARFLAAPGLVLTGSDLSRPSGATLLACAEERDCGPADIRPVRYDPGHFAYEVRSDTAVEALLNESYYPGWEVRLCDGGSCTSLEPARSELGLLDLALPAGDYMLELDYRTPGRLAGWVSFGSGIVLAFAALVGASTGWARRKKATVKA